MFPKHWRVTRVLNAGIEVDLDEVEKCFQVRIPPVFCLLLSSGCYFVQEGQNLFGTDAVNSSSFADIFAEFAKGGTIRLDGIFSPNSFRGTQDRLGLRAQAS